MVTGRVMSPVRGESRDRSARFATSAPESASPARASPELRCAIGEGTRPCAAALARERCERGDAAPLRSARLPDLSPAGRIGPPASYDDASGGYVVVGESECVSRKTRSNRILTDARG